MRTYEVTFNYRTRPWYREGQTKQEKHVFNADSELELLRQARTWGNAHFSNRRWKLIDTRELTQPTAKGVNRADSDAGR